MELDALDRDLLERLQSAFPLSVRPFEALGQALDVDTAEVLARVRRLKEENAIRQISAIFDTRRLGYQSTLVAFHVPDGALESVANKVSAHPGVSHNYARPHHYNLWFTLAVPPGAELGPEIARVAGGAGVDDWLNLPATRMFKLRTHFTLGERAASSAGGGPKKTRPSGRDFVPSDIPFVRALQRDLPIVVQPFAEAADRLNLSQEELLDRAQELKEAGIMRRFGAVLRHRRVGYQANGMACWVVPEAEVEAAGLCAAAFPQVSHCYERPAYPPRWPYTLFTMVHGQTREQVEGVVAQIAQETGIEEYEVLYSTREFKKERIRYFGKVQSGAYEEET
jgi:DNA-binding Lrp family transcriptional regulator